MSHELPDDWYEKHDGQRLVLSSEKVAAKISRLQVALDRACEIALGTDLTQEAAEEILKLRNANCG